MSPLFPPVIVAGIEYAIRLGQVGGNRFAECAYDPPKITIGSGLGVEPRLMYLWHEVRHAIDEQIGLELPDNDTRDTHHLHSRCEFAFFRDPRNWPVMLRILGIDSKDIDRICKRRR